jgi:hypothetical protein
MLEKLIEKLIVLIFRLLGFLVRFAFRTLVGVVSLAFSLISKMATSYAEMPSSHPVASPKAPASRPQLAQVGPSPAQSKQVLVQEKQPEKPFVRRELTEHPTLQEALDSYEDSRREEREASYELLGEELSATVPANQDHINALDVQVGGPAVPHPKLGWKNALESEIAAERLLAAHIPLSRRTTEDRYKFVYYIAPIGNLRSIASHGLLSHVRVEALGIERHDISDPSVQRWRDRPDGIYRRPIHDYVPLYFNPRNPMLYKRRDQQHELVILEISVAAASCSEHLFTDGNAAAAKTKFGRTIETVRAAEQALFARNWTDCPDGKRQRCAEMLVVDRVPVECFVRAIAIHAIAEAQASSVLPCPVTIDSSFFF